MTKKIAINGFGRIGRTFLRVLSENKKLQKELEVVAINIGPGKIDQVALLFQHDSVMGGFPGTAQYSNGNLRVNGYNIKILAELDPLRINWGDLEIDWVVEATGRFCTKEKAQHHCKSGCKKVLITAPCLDEDVTIIPGVNDSDYDSTKHAIVSMGSCTTNCLAPIVKVLKESFNFTQGLMTTIHAYTNDQVLLDSEHNDPRRARAAALNIIPTKTGAEKVITKIYPELEGKIRANAIRVPTPVVSLVDLTFTTAKSLTKEKINEAFKKYSENQLKGTLEYCIDPLVSSDFIQNCHSCIIDSQLTTTTGNISKVFGWYDNEYGYCCRLKDFLLHN